MIDNEKYQKELIRMLDSLRINKYKGRNNCNGVDCKECPLQGFKYGCSNALSSLEIYCAVEKWSKEHPQKKFKVSRMEYDMLQIYAINHISNNDTFNDFYTLRGLLNKGYFEGAKPSDKIADYIENCEVKEDV